MTQLVKPTIREVLLTEIKAQEPRTRTDQSLQATSVLNAAAKTLGAACDQQAILTQWSELFRTGLLAWGLNLANPNPPFFHFTESGRQALSNLTRDPSNPGGYLRHLASIATLDNIAISYLTEGLECYAAGLFKAAAVMIGAAAESIILDLRDKTLQKLTALGRPIPKQMQDWKVKTVSEGLYKLLQEHKATFGRDLHEPFEAYWSAFSLQIRTTRNDAGHPTSVEPVTPDSVHASLLIFPELARLANNLLRWVDEALK
jgi:hypothetical protein